jgi:hypothetical protein
VLVCCGLNPSTADGDKDDHTIRRWVAFARRDGFGGILVVNAWPWRATRQSDLRSAIRAHGDSVVCGGIIDAAKYWTQADAEISAACAGQTVLVCWGAPGAWARGRLSDVLDTVTAAAARVVCLGRTSTGHPRHPARLRSDTPMESYP